MKFTLSDVSESEAMAIRQLLRDSLHDFRKIRANGSAAQYVAFRYDFVPGSQEFSKKVEEVNGRFELAQSILCAVSDMEIELDVV